MFSWLRKKKVGEISQESNLEKLAEERLRRAVKDHAEAVTVARKMQKASMLKQQAKEMMEAARDIDDDEDEDYDDDEDDEEDYLEGLPAPIKDAILSRLSGAKAPQPAASVTPPQNAALSPLQTKVIDQVKRMDDKQLKEYLSEM